MSDQITPSADVTDDDKLWGMLAYILNIIIPFIIPIVILLMEDKKSRPFLKYHAIQSLVLMGVATVTLIIVIGVCVYPLCAIYSIYLGIKAYQGEMVEIPVITDFVKKQGWV